MTRRRLLALTFGLCVCLAQMPRTVFGAETLSFGIVSSETSVSLLPKWGPFLADMERETGIAVHPVFAPDYAGVISAMRSGSLQVALMGNKSALEVIEKAPASLFATPIGLDGQGTYQSCLVVRTESGLTTLEDVIKKAGSLNLAYGDPNSTSGYVVPSYYIFTLKGIDPRRVFKHITYGSHEANALAVARGVADVGTISSTALGGLKAVHPEDMARLNVIWRSPHIPNDPLVWRTDLPQDTRDKLRSFVLSYGRQDRPDGDRERAVLNTLGWLRFEASDNGQLETIRHLFR